MRMPDVTVCFVLLAFFPIAATFDVSSIVFMNISALSVGRAELPLKTYQEGEEGEALPENFDARDAWPNCKSIGEIPDQGACGDCWAVGTLAAATDRMCIATNATQQQRLSVEHMVGCCHVCGYGCGDGFPNYAWAWLAGQKGTPYGVVSGGGYSDNQWCSSYTVPPCNHFQSLHNPRPSCESGPPHPTPKCPTQCDSNSTYKVPFAKDIHQFKTAYAVDSSEAAIQQEIASNGPVTAGFNVYSDWTHYHSGVYKVQGGTELGGHAVKIIGWGVEDGENYWLVANSFGVTWGDKGFFKISRGTGSCGIEQNVVAGEFL